MCTTSLQEVDEMAPEECRGMLSAASPGTYYEKLTHSQQEQINNWNSKRNILIQEKTHRSISKILDSETELSRKSTRFIRYYVKAWSDGGRDIGNNEAILTVWDPTEDQMSVLQEGLIVRCKNLGVKSCNGLLQVTARSSTCMQPISPQPPLYALESLGYTPRAYRPFMYLSLASRKLRFAPMSYPEYDCAGCLVKAIQDSSGRLLIYLLDESNFLIRIERELDDENDASLRHWKNGMLDLSPGTCLFLRDIRMIPFDPWEECAVGVWTESSSQHLDRTRMEQLQPWYSTIGQADCHLSSLKLSCGIPTFGTPSNTVMAVGHISGFELLSVDADANNKEETTCLHDFVWGLAIDTGDKVVRAAVSTQYHSLFSQMCNPALLEVMERNIENSELPILVEYFNEHFRRASTLLRFVIDVDTEYLLHVKEADVCAITQLYP